MMMGPAPMMRMLLMSVRFGMVRRSVDSGFGCLGAGGRGRGWCCILGHTPLGQLGKQRLRPSGRKVLLPQLQQAVALDQWAHDFFFRVIKRPFPLLQHLCKGG